MRKDQRARTRKGKPYVASVKILLHFIGKPEYVQSSATLKRKAGSPQVITYCYKVCKKYIIQAAPRIKKVNNKSDRKQEFKREVYNFLVAEKEGVRTTEFNIEELKTYLLSQDSTFTQVFIVINKSYCIFCP